MNSYGKGSAAITATDSSIPFNCASSNQQFSLSIMPQVTCKDERLSAVNNPPQQMMFTLPSTGVSSSSSSCGIVTPGMNLPHIQLKQEHVTTPTATVVPLILTSTTTDSHRNGTDNFPPSIAPGGVIHVICASSSGTVGLHSESFNAAIPPKSNPSGNNVPLSVNLVPAQFPQTPQPQRQVLRVSLAHPLAGPISLRDPPTAQVFTLSSSNNLLSQQPPIGIEHSSLPLKVPTAPLESGSTVVRSHRVGRRCKPKEDKRCEVCGDRALSCNFDALTCESCKAFFRRNASKGIGGFNCPYQGSCTITASSRRMCKHCRLRKCFEIGMKKEYILTNEERFMKKMKITQNKILKKLEDRGWIGKELSTAELSEKDLLTESEIHLIDEALAACDASLKVKMEERCGKREGPSITDLVNLAEISIRRAIEMFKRIKAFRSMDKRIQILLLKGGCIELLVLRGVLAYDPEKQRFLDAVDNEQADSLSLSDLMKGAGGEAGLAFQRLLNTLLNRMQADRVTILMLLLVCLFSDRTDSSIAKGHVKVVSGDGQQPPHLEDMDVADDTSATTQEERRATIEKVQLQYTDLLKKFLSTKWSVEKAARFFPQIMMCLTDLRTMNEHFSRQVMCLNLHSVTPLMTEILDIPESPHDNDPSETHESADSDSCSSFLGGNSIGDEMEVEDGHSHSNGCSSLEVDDEMLDLSSGRAVPVTTVCSSPMQVTVDESLHPGTLVTLSSGSLGLDVLEPPSVVSQQALSIGSDAEFITSLLDTSGLNVLPLSSAELETSGSGALHPLHLSTPELLALTATSPPPSSTSAHPIHLVDPRDDDFAT